MADTEQDIHCDQGFILRILQFLVHVLHSMKELNVTKQAVIMDLEQLVRNGPTNSVFAASMGRSSVSVHVSRT